jgi:hypothetical protein
MAMIADNTMPHTINWVVFHSRVLISVETALREMKLSPQSPLTKSLAQLPYWTGSGSFNPRRSRSRSTSPGSRLCARRAVGSVVALTKTNNSIDAMITTGIEMRSAG